MSSYSYSRLNTFLNCPAAFKAQYLDKRHFNPSPPMIVGGLLHRIFETYTQHLKKSGLKTDISAMPKITESAYYEKDLGLEASAIDEVMEISQQFAEKFILNLDTFYGSELKLAITKDERKTEWTDWTGAFFRSIIDRIDKEDNRVVITDYKTGYSIEKDTWQQAIYAWLVRDLFPECDTFTLKTHYVRLGYIDSVEITLADIAKAKKKALNTIKMIEKERVFPPRPGNNCGSCSFLADCGQIMKLEGTVPMISSPEKAREYAQKLIIAEYLISRVKNALKAYAKETGPIDLGTGSYGHHYSESPKLPDVAAFCEAMWAENKEPWDFLSVNMTKAKKLLKIPAIEALVEMKGYTTFKFEKGGGMDEG